MKSLMIIPAFNEEENIGKTVGQVLATNPRISVLVINDGSVDKTAKIAQRAGALVISHPFNMGYGAALQTGYKYALDRGFDCLIQMDADGQHDPKFIKDLLRPLIDNQADLVIGSRFLKYSYDMTFFKKIGVIIFRLVIKLLTGQIITDPTSGFRAFKSNLLDVFTSDIYPTDFPDADLLITLLRGGIKIKDVPVKMYQSPRGKKPMHQGLVALYYIFKLPLSILVGLIRSKGLPRRYV
jgi:glycosyltransferase involved in cell wall biosynthesis